MAIYSSLSFCFNVLAVLKLGCILELIRSPAGLGKQPSDLGMNAQAAHGHLALSSVGLAHMIVSHEHCQGQV